jgi:hypothetical protein
LREKEQGTTALGDWQMVEQFVASWLELVKHTIKPRTWRRYGAFVRLHVIAVVAALRAHRARQLEDHMRLGPARADRDLVFPDEAGTPLDGISVLRASFYALLKRTGLPRIRSHETCATRWRRCCWRTASTRRS